MQERRRYVRWPINIAATYRLHDSQEEFSCLAKDVSIRGIGLEFTEKLDNHSVIILNIPTKNSIPINIKAEVMWQSEERNSGLFETGFYFTSLKEEDREKILKLAGK